MGRDLAEKFPIAQQTFAEADEALGFSISQLCFEGPEEQLKLTEYQQPAICTVSVAALRVLREQGVEPAVVAGTFAGRVCGECGGGIAGVCGRGADSAAARQVHAGSGAAGTGRDGRGAGAEFGRDGEGVRGCGGGDAA